MAAIGSKIKGAVTYLKNGIAGFFVKNSSDLTEKRDVNFRNIFILFGCFVLTFIGIVLYLPGENAAIFREVTKNVDTASHEAHPNDKKSNASNLWASPPLPTRSQMAGASQNTSMQVLPHGGNSKLELHAGLHLRIQVVDKFIASSEGVPVLGRLVENATSESGISIPEGSLLYGEATYNKSLGRAAIQFRKISYPSGEIRNISANALGSDGQPGIEGRVHSDALKNSAGQFISTFVGAVASGSVQRDFIGQSQGGLKNGLLTGASQVAMVQSQKYANSLNNEREWIEVSSGTSCEAIIEQTYKMIEGDQP